ncbi:unnamed protein product [Blepharisma stoltei]|uniref:Ubiquitin-like domain-containing protein n=1 Tax=Blepharisma stoltei TaxID=1481888 RepID=A0AAU9IRS7_9CILI|nr:unnamed protein product [Blepharisma stoltei]
MSLRIIIQVIGGENFVVEASADMKFSELYQNIQAALSLTNDLKILKNPNYLNFNRDGEKSLLELKIMNNSCLDIEIIPDLYISVEYGDRKEVLEIRSSDMKLSEFTNLVKAKFNISQDIEMHKEVIIRNYKKRLDLATEENYSLKDLDFTSSTSVRVSKDEIRIMIEFEDGFIIFNTKKTDTFETLERNIRDKLGKRGIVCILGSKTLRVPENGSSTLEALGISANSKLIVLDCFNGGFILLKL